MNKMTNTCCALVFVACAPGHVFAADDTNDLKTANDELFHSEKLDTAIRLGTGGHAVDRGIAAAKEKMHEIMDPRVEKVSAKIRSIGQRLGIESDDSTEKSESNDSPKSTGSVRDEYWKARDAAEKRRLENLDAERANRDDSSSRLPQEAKRACDSVLPGALERRSCYNSYGASIPADAWRTAPGYPRNLAEAEDLCDAPAKRDWTMQPVADACRKAMAERFAPQAHAGSDRLQGLLDDSSGRKTGAAGLESIMQQQRQQEVAAAERARQAALDRQRAEIAAREAQLRAQQQQRAAELARQAAAQAQADSESDDGMALFGQVVGAAMNAAARRATVPTYTAPPSRPTAYGSQSGGSNGIGSQSSGSVTPPAAGGSTSRSPCYPNAC